MAQITVQKIRLLAAVLLLCPLAWAADEKKPAQAPTREILSQIEKNMAGITTLSADFVQEKNLAAFQNKLIIKGKIFLAQPGRLAWHVDSPMKYSMVLDNAKVRQWDADSNQTQEMSLDRTPAVGMAIEQMKKWFSGAYSSLENDYRISLLSEKPTEFEFIPRDGNSAGKFISVVKVRFRPDCRYISRIFIVEKNGDTTDLVFNEAQINTKIPAKAWQCGPVGSQ